MRSLVHQIGNSLQSLRGEVDLLRLSGALPQRSFDRIVQGIENIRELTAGLDTADGAKTPAADNGRDVSGSRKCAEEVRRGRI